jgi:hypothetical protein
MKSDTEFYPRIFYAVLILYDLIGLHDRLSRKCYSLRPVDKGEMWLLIYFLLLRAVLIGVPSSSLYCWYVYLLYVSA